MYLDIGIYLSDGDVKTTPINVLTVNYKHYWAAGKNHRYTHIYDKVSFYSQVYLEPSQT